MSINGIEQSGVPLGPDPLRTHQAKRGSESPAPDAHSAQSARPSGAQDRVEISDAARSLSGAHGAEGAHATRAAQPSAPVSETITADRVRTILARVNDSFYDRPETQREVAKKLLPDLRSLTTG